MTLPALLLLSLCAAPAVDSQWAWAYDDARTMKVTGAPAGTTVSISPHLEKTQLELKVLEVGEDGPKKFKVTVKTGPATLRARSFEVESNYGEAVLKEVTRQGTRATFNLQELYAAGVAQDLHPGAEQAVLQRVLATLFKPDPIVTAARSGTPCSEATSAAVVKAVAQVTTHLMFARTGDEALKDAEATCLGSDGTKYSVRFTLRYPFRDEGLDAPFSGTVSIPPNTWRAGLDLKSTWNAEVKNSTKTPMVVKSSVALRSAVTKK